MLWTLLVLAAWISPTRDAAVVPPVSPETFRCWFEAARQGKLDIPEAVRRDARRYRYVFVEGFWNERMHGYFSRNIQELRALGVPLDAIHTISPSSHQAGESHAAAVRDAFQAVAAHGRERLVVIAHSRGACDALAFALSESDFVRDRVAALFLVQGPFGGTGIADYVTGDGPPTNRSMPPRHRAVVRLLAWFQNLRLAAGSHAGLHEMTRQASRDYWTLASRQQAAALPIVGPKTYFITTESRAPRLRPIRRAFATYLTAYFGPNDGVVVRDDQSLPGLGAIVRLRDIGHNDLTRHFPAGRRGRTRAALIDAILMTVARQ